MHEFTPIVQLSTSVCVAGGREVVTLGFFLVLK
jgi:hypothetical protein